MPRFTVTPSGPPQTAGTRWMAQADTPGEAPFLLGQTVAFTDGDGPHRGLFQTRVIKDIPKLHFDRAAASAKLGLWAQMIWPTVMAEGGGHHLVVNTYDRAAFTFGFYQLAAHTPDDNLILLFRALLALPNAADYYPDLSLVGGRVHRGAASLERVTRVTRPNGKVEDQTLDFMRFLNPDPRAMTTTAAEHAARLMHWLVHDPAAVDASVSVALSILRRKLRALATAHGLGGRDPLLAIWVSDIRHQGRGKAAEINAALAQPGLEAQLRTLAAIGAGSFSERIVTVQRCVETLRQEGVFGGVALGDAKLAL